MLICNELSCIYQGNKQVIITNTMNTIATLQSSKFNVFLHGYVLQCTMKNIFIIQYYYKRFGVITIEKPLKILIIIIISFGINVFFQ